MEKGGGFFSYPQMTQISQIESRKCVDMSHRGLAAGEGAADGGFRPRDGGAAEGSGIEELWDVHEDAQGKNPGGWTRGGLK